MAVEAVELCLPIKRAKSNKDVMLKINYSYCTMNYEIIPWRSHWITRVLLGEKKRNHTKEPNAKIRFKGLHKPVNDRWVSGQYESGSYLVLLIYSHTNIEKVVINHYLFGDWRREKEKHDPFHGFPITPHRPRDVVACNNQGAGSISIGTCHPHHCLGLKYRNKHFHQKQASGLIYST